jgi:hypothetical protein
MQGLQTLPPKFTKFLMGVVAKTTGVSTSITGSTLRLDVNESVGSAHILLWLCLGMERCQWFSFNCRRAAAFQLGCRSMRIYRKCLTGVNSSAGIAARDGPRSKSFLGRIAIVCIALVLIACARRVDRFYVAAAPLSASAFDLQTNGGEPYGQYLYSFLSPSSDGPVVRSLIFRVRFTNRTIEVRANHDHRCRDWQLKTVSPQRLQVNFGPEVVTYFAYPRSEYDKDVEVLRLTAAALRGRSGGVVDYFKPNCPVH